MSTQFQNGSQQPNLLKSMTHGVRVHSNVPTMDSMFDILSWPQQPSGDVNNVNTFGQKLKQNQTMSQIIHVGDYTNQSKQSLGALNNKKNKLKPHQVKMGVYSYETVPLEAAVNQRRIQNHKKKIKQEAKNKKQKMKKSVNVQKKNKKPLLNFTPDVLFQKCHSVSDQKNIVVSDSNVPLASRPPFIAGSKKISQKSKRKSPSGVSQLKSSQKQKQSLKRVRSADPLMKRSHHHVQSAESPEYQQKQLKFFGNRDNLLEIICEKKARSTKLAYKVTECYPTDIAHSIVVPKQVEHVEEKKPQNMSILAKMYKNAQNSKTNKEMTTLVEELVLVPNGTNARPAGLSSPRGITARDLIYGSSQ